MHLWYSILYFDFLLNFFLPIDIHIYVPIKLGLRHEGRGSRVWVWAKSSANICPTNASLCTQSASPLFKCTNKDHQLRRYTVTIKSYHPCWIRPHRPRSLVCWCRVRQRAHALQAVYTPGPDRIALKQIPGEIKSKCVKKSRRVIPTSTPAYLICWQ